MSTHLKGQLNTFIATSIEMPKEDCGFKYTLIEQDDLGYYLIEFENTPPAIKWYFGHDTNLTVKNIRHALRESIKDSGTKLYFIDYIDRDGMEPL